ncbi:MAG: hypothetical protein EU544_06780 [Promethearchaeota archaeon]|nr:MAG: hypothetical protein EU544_06780 [Candidatus Lokiarchaeota archaeon]
MDEADFLVLSQLFDSIGIIEKGIDRIYHYLLKNKRIEDLKKICSDFGLSLKRGYKVASVLNDLELVQIYDRPMKIQLATPVVPIWQKIINTRIEQLRKEFQEKKDKSENTFEEFLRNYNLKEEIIPEPVEFLSYSIDNFDDLYYTYIASNRARMALGIRYENPLIPIIKDNIDGDLPKETKEILEGGIESLKKNLEDLDLKIIFSEDFLKNTLHSEEFEYLLKKMGSFGIKFKSLEVRVFMEDFSNFSLTEDELIQPSFDPTNKLIGAYISRNEKIYQIFSDKFNEIFDQAFPLVDYLKKSEEFKVNSLNETECFVLTLL